MRGRYYAGLHAPGDTINYVMNLVVLIPIYAPGAMQSVQYLSHFIFIQSCILHLICIFLIYLLF